MTSVSRTTAGSDLERALLFQIRAAGLPEPEVQFRAVPERRWRWDFAWPFGGPINGGLLVEVDGATWTAGRHTRGQGYEDDCEKQSVAAALGWRTMRFTRNQVESGRAVELIEEAL